MNALVRKTPQHLSESSPRKRGSSYNICSDKSSQLGVAGSINYRHNKLIVSLSFWIPAFAGMTGGSNALVNFHEVALDAYFSRQFNECNCSQNAATPFGVIPAKAHCCPGKINITHCQIQMRVVERTQAAIFVVFQYVVGA
jgi:hypothetical protein